MTRCTPYPPLSPEELLVVTCTMPMWLTVVGNEVHLELSSVSTYTCNEDMLHIQSCTRVSSAYSCDSTSVTPVAALAAAVPELCVSVRRIWYTTTGSQVASGMTGGPGA